jgi:hypothetical protein
MTFSAPQSFIHGVKIEKFDLRACELALFQGMEQMRDNRRLEAPKARGVE